MFKSYLLLKTRVISIVFLCLVSCSKETSVKSQYVVPHCLPSQSMCTIETQYGDFSVLFNVDKVTTEKEFSISLQSVNTVSDRENGLNHRVDNEKPMDLSKLEVIAFLEGRDMYMGKIPLFFKLSDKGELSAEAMIGSCTEEKMFWRLSLTIKNKEDVDLANDNVKQAMFADRYLIDFESSRS